MNITRLSGRIVFFGVTLYTNQMNLSSAKTTGIADSIIISKSAHTLSLMSGKTVLKTSRVAIGRGSVGRKQFAGDNRTPEGRYIIDEKNSASKFHKALHISYPNAEDKARVINLGRSPGGDIEIHGLPTDFAWVGPAQHALDWTAGRIALTNEEIDELWNMVAVGTAVEIDP
jgi:murein L,D-transpeptidase YafK